MNSIVTAIIIISAMGIIAALMLVIAAKVLYVPED